jgi:hypothetical protein
MPEIDIRKIVERGVTEVTINKNKPGQIADVMVAKKSSSFWKGKTFEDLAKEQGIKPVKDVNRLKGHWPEGADFESFFETAVNSRKHAEDN